ncbi:proline dehydrogenase family protein [Aestuariimicrobium soli]|uniref:proline dehydrogenase family protein n=1 Tax=Aestuariimicrobium soli TaxID=2035834 RepID=UPI003EBF38C1
MRSRVEAAPGTDELVSRFVAGENAVQAVAVADDLVGKGLVVTFDHLGENATSEQAAQECSDGYLELLRAVADRPWAGSVDVSVKLSAMGLLLGRAGEGLAHDFTRRICEAATAIGATVTIDMEDHTTTDATLAIVERLRADFPSTGAVIQAYLRRTESDARELATAGSRVRLCKGAYSEPAGVAWQGRHEIDRAYVRALRVLMEGDGHPMVATHDPRLIEIAAALAKKVGRTPDSFEFQMLHGVRPLEQRRLVDIGNQCRIYLPYGTDWYGYFTRRVAEKPATASLFARQLVGRR